MRNLYIHAGLPKTGTSAFQTFCGRNVSFLKESLGVLYPDYCGSIEAAAKGAITSGNGLAVAAALGSPIPGATEMIDQGLHQTNELFDNGFNSGCDSALLSSEWFSAVCPEDFSSFSEACQKHEINLHILFVVRDVIPWVYSLYGEAVKGGYCSCSFDDYLTDERLDLLKNIMNIHAASEAKSGFSIKVLNYSDIKSSVGRSILEEIVGSKPDIRWPSESKGERVNRSLTALELEIVRRANEFLPPDYGRKISKALMSEFYDNSQKYIPAKDMLGSEANEIIENINSIICGSPIKLGSIQASDDLETVDYDETTIAALKIQATAFFAALGHQQAQMGLASGGVDQADQGNASSEKEAAQDDVAMSVNLPLRQRLWKSLSKHRARRG